MAKTNEIGYQAVPLAGGTMTGLLVLSGDPVTALGAATKQYADAIAAGFTVKMACVCATTANLNATQAGAGVGATLTNAGAMAPFSTDGISPVLNDRILVKDQTLTQHNGIYTLTTVGSGAVNWVLTRATDYDQPAEIQPGNLIPVTMGNLYEQTSWIQTATVATVDTDPVLFSQFTASPNTFATVSLSNLAGVAINTSLLPNADNSLDFGSATDRWANLYTTGLRTGTGNNNVLILQVRDTGGATWDDIFTLTAQNPPTATISGIVTSVTQAPSDNSTKLATTAYADAIGALKANVSLNNLAGVAINTSLVSDTDITDDLGSPTIRWLNAYPSTVRTGSADTNTLLLQARDVDGASWTSFITLTAGNTPTCALSGSVTGVTQAPGDNSTKLATTQYVDASAAAGAPVSATYITQTPNATLTNEQALSLLTTGLMKNTTATGVISIAAAGTDYVAPSTTITIAGTANEITSSAGAQDLSANRTWTLSLPNALTFTGKTVTGGALSGVSATTFTFTTGTIGTAVTGVTQAPLTSNTTIATTKYVDDAVTAGASGANTALSNLAAVAINTSLISDTDNTDDLGSASIRWSNIYTATLRTGSTDTNTLLIQARDVDGASWTTFATLTAGNTPTMALAGAVTGVTQAAADNSTKLATTAYADRMVPLAGGTMTGLLILSGDPSNALGAVTKQYADNIAGGNNYKDSVVAASTAALTVTYSNGVAGVGATLTNAGTQATFALDGQSPSVGQRVLIKNQASSFQNGIYSVTNVGSGATNWVLTRTTDYNTAPTEIKPGDLVPVENGTVNANTLWLQTATVTTIGTDAITFQQFSSAPLTLPVSLANGGTNASLTANNGGIFYSTGTAGAILAGTATARQMLQSGATAAPTWSTATWPATTTINQILYSSAANTVAGLATANSSLLVTDGSGVPSLSTAIPSGVTATTQSASDNSTKVATTAYVDSAAGSASVPLNFGFGNSACNFYVPNTLSPSASAFVMVANTIYCMPITIGSTKTFTKIGVEVTSTGASSSCRLGIYDSTGTGGFPGARVLDAGTIDSHTATGNKTITISQSLKGNYWLVVICNATAPQLRAGNSIASVSNWPECANVGVANIDLGFGGVAGLSEASVSSYFTALPSSLASDTFSIIAPASGLTAPLVFLQV
jgi:hypothetical protein